MSPRMIVRLLGTALLLALLVMVSRKHFGSFQETVTKAMRQNINQSMYACPVYSDCWRLQKLITEEWDATKPKAAVYILSRASDFKTLIETLQDLERNFLSKYQYPVIIFYEEDFIPLIDAVRNCTKLKLFFQEVQFEVPDFLDPPGTVILNCRREIGYKHMCRFNAKVVYDLPITKNLEYMLRLDAHSYLRSPVPYDLFKYAKEKGIDYMYPIITATFPACVKYAVESVQLYAKVKRIKPLFMDKMVNEKGGLRIFYNNFELSKTSIFTSLRYQNFIRYIDALGGIFYHRWGDAPIKTMAVTLFIPENRTMKIQDFTYAHRTKTLTN